ncbi:C-5 cytosine-specific DNA methylase [Marinobacter lipolyticus SM19]|uniref:DNA (cytosine-5-)-methyltransferase n=1 Tax=Marinobacter lipolyticus SM19 TaxID=1318628 RepID=R8B3S3_9GAMM|nr:DNA (cytosine-5-)-methyltransferase [Marinobacter lipolyticus]EON93164.1 C-5 cytosine-specific DNA methylase [Marinobacter lipolyticus SM19]
MSSKIHIVDLFAGPGGLGEGFSSFEDAEGRRPFKLVASVEKEASAHRTLTLRAFFRQFEKGEVPKAYYDYVKAGDPKLRKELFDAFKSQSEAAIEETLGTPRALGSEDHYAIFDRIKAVKQQHRGPWVVIGGPPCQAYSVVGRARNRGVEGYQPENDPRHFLYKEYLKVLREVEPEVFVMENVRGILTAKVHGSRIFDSILRDLRNPAKSLGESFGVEYDIYSLSMPLPYPDALGDRTYQSNTDYLIKAEEFGIPQTRHRVILLGVRKNVLKEGESPRMLSRREPPYFRTSDVIRDLPPLRSGLTKIENTSENWHQNLQQAAKAVQPWLEECGIELPRDFLLNAVKSSLDSQGANYVPDKRGRKVGSSLPTELKNWFFDENLEGCLNHFARSHMPSDIFRYLFASSFAEHKGGASPKSGDYNHPDSIPAHKNWGSGHFVDRFKVQARDRTPSTVTSHIAKDGHYFIHYAPSQCRSLTVREAARIQTFPDNYFFEGNRTQQYVQVGNAVPPLLANQIADVVYDLLK